ncbi:DUF3243 family protein [Sulfobacillus harzensis]|uniref:DUF3243 domain-containing protein n=1 Tax=Sulfobacillus harzensis TaxID=2729629 RepID=A0A7Y0Q320_9FIRM|nr:DUF3243 family protein [Sulfobacillus harzensis]NMP22501.1 DUF3243 domain-containing protein [Sulfobacillus harzensis]
MAKGVPSSFQDLKQKAAKRIQQGDHDVKSDVIDMGNAMQQAGVEPKNAQDRLAKNVWQSAGPEEKETLASMVTNMAKKDADLQ